MTPTPQMMVDLQSLSRALLDTLNDKNMALSHQRKANKSVETSVIGKHSYTFSLLFPFLFSLDKILTAD